MQKWTALLFATLTVAAIVGVFAGRGAGKGAPSQTSSADAGTDAAAALTAEVDAGEVSDAGAEPSEPAESVGAMGSDAGATLLSGELPPPLPATAPKSVVFGVILVQYKGAQGAQQVTRSREEALALAKKLAEEAKTDFKAAVAKGDKGSMENAGRIPRGMLEPAPEYVLFSLPKEGVSEPVDTPRGFWIARRIE